MQSGGSSAPTVVWVALDVPSPEEAGQWMATLAPHTHFKLGLELFLAAGPEHVARWTQQGRKIFLDLKLHDIPNTVAGAVRQVRRLGVELVTVHAAGGSQMLSAAVEAAAGQVVVTAVTVLTSLDDHTLASMGVPPSTRWAQILASEAADAGVHALVTSANEVEMLRREHPEMRLVVPGIRPRGAPAGDQRRVASPDVAVRRGATDLVVGRPVLTAPDPVAALRNIVDEVTLAYEA